MSKQDPKSGEGFTMKDAQTAEAAHPHNLDFATLVFSFATSAMVHLGQAPDPMSQKTEKNLPLAKQNIDILGVLEAKTRGNLSNEEKELLENSLSELRMLFVKASRN